MKSKGKNIKTEPVKLVHGSITTKKGRGKNKNDIEYVVNISSRGGDQMDTEVRKLQGNNQGAFMITLPPRFIMSLDLHKKDMIRLDLNGDNKQIVIQKVVLQ